MKKNKKAATDVTIQSGLENPIITGGNQSDFVFNYDENKTKTQVVCDKCNPIICKPNGMVELCANCVTSGERLAGGLFEHIKQHRKIVRLHRCLACNECVAAAKFSIYWGICKSCLGNKDESKAARSKFISRALNNISKVLRGAMAL